MKDITTFINESILDGVHPKNEPLYIVKRGLGKPWLNEFDKILSKLPEGAIPDVFCSFSSINKIIDRKLITARENKTKYGVTISSNTINIPKEQIDDEMLEKKRKWLNKDEDAFNHLIELQKDLKLYPDFIHKFKSNFVVMAINSRLVKSPSDLVARKEKANELYKEKNGNDYWVNLSGLSTLVHECGHVFDNNKGRLSDKSDWLNLHRKWVFDGAPDLCKKASEAFPEAFANVILENGNKLPNYIKSYMKSKF